MAHCDGAGNWVCDASSYGPQYDPNEATCDGQDHNCDGVPSGTVQCSPTCCQAGDVCVGAGCGIPGGACSGDSSCQGDTRCQAGNCSPWADGGYDPTCTRPAQPPHFSPSIRCAWPPPATDGGYNAGADPNHIQVITTPVVADFKLYSRPHPMVVFPTQNSLGGGNDEAIGNATYYGLLRILDPQTCTVVATLDAADQHVVASSTPAIGDLDGDGRPDIVASATGGGMVAFTYDTATSSWKTLWHSSLPDGGPGVHLPDGGIDKVNTGSGMWAGPALADLDDDGFPEIVFGAEVFDHNGVLRGNSQGLQRYLQGNEPVVADVNLDGVPELLTGNRVFSYSNALKDFQPSTFFSTDAGINGFVALGRFGNFPLRSGPDQGYPQIAVVGSGWVRVQTIDGQVVFGPYRLPPVLPDGGSAGGGPPTIGDFNGDGQPDIAAAGYGSFSVFSFHCRPDSGPLPADCAGPGLLWSKTSQDYTSNVTGSSLFDFTGSGRVNGVYADECFTRVYDGPTGDVIYSQWHSSCTWYENPVVADVLANYSSQLVVPSNQNCAVSCTNSVDVDPSGRSVDKQFNGLHCDTAADCPSANDTCVGGLCRCQSDDDCCSAPGTCPANGFVCAPPPAAGNPASGKTCRAVYNGAYPGVRIYADAQNRWADSRGIWNQHAYAVTNVNDDGTIPRTSQAQRNWQVAGLNNFRQNVQGQLTPLAAPHLTISLGVSCLVEGDLNINATICNRGSGGVPDGVPFSVTDGTGQDRCSGATANPLGPGECTAFDCTWYGPPSGEQTLAGVVDAQATTRPCMTGGNTAVVYGVRCSP